ncbi:ArdC family protein [Candidatus Entotheonella palauensis]|uniref:ArdC family protein n=1 Tax=Candidatus Entotheonella palauensis TaxID=93172 RepID=UPI000B7FD8D9|nr:zincin-like metallopeptidase domain-containing protein [Candidatus Entotheonella palauensis]
MRHQTDLYQRITDQIVSAIEQSASTGRFRLPWHNNGFSTMEPINAQSGRSYRGINTLALWVAAMRSGDETGQWATYRQWQALGAQVKRGEKSSLVVFWKTMPPKDKEAEHEADGTAHPEPRLVARSYSVFNVQQVKDYTPPVAPTLSEDERIECTERFFATLGGAVHHGGFEAYYDSGQDRIHIPNFRCFFDNVGYYSTLAHEYTHWTGHSSRLGRDLCGRFGSHAYAAEELVAELGAAFCCARLNLTVEPRQDHAKYLKSWLDVLRTDKRAIFTAASKAQQAVDWMDAQQGEDRE